MTMGDEGGTAHPMFKQMSSYTAGNSVIYLEKLPAINLTCPTTGNNMNNAAGAVLVPSVTNVFFTLERSASGASLDEAIAPRNEDPVTAGRQGDSGPVVVTIARFTTDVARRVFVALEAAGLCDGDEVVFDLRGCPGGDARAALDLAGEFCDRGVVLARFRRADGDETVIKSRGAKAYDARLRVLVDARTASAAELFAGVAAVSCGASLEGERTYGKATAQQVRPADGRGTQRYETVGEYVLADGTAFQGCGLSPASAPR
jgi:carboxyl-terminal processing protease